MIPIHILFSHQAFATPRETGATRHYELFSELVRKGHEVTVLRSDRNYKTGDKEKAVSDVAEAPEGLEIVEVPNPGPVHRNFLWRLFSYLTFSLFSLLRGLRVKDVDVVVGTSPPLPQVFPMWIVARAKRAGFVIEVRDLWPDFPVEMGVLTNPLLVRLGYFLEETMYGLPDQIIINSPAYREHIGSFSEDTAPVVLIPNGVSTADFGALDENQELRRDYGIGEEFLVVYAGAHGPAQDLGTVLDAAIRLEDENVHFLFVGDGKDRSKLIDKSKRLGLANVTFLEPRPKDEIPAILAAADACVATLQDIPMFRKTYPNKVFDYMASGNPTILGIDGVIREVIEEAGGGVYAEPGDPEDLAQAVRHLMEHPDDCQEMGERARKHVGRNFDWTIHAERMEDVVTATAPERPAA